MVDIVTGEQMWRPAECVGRDTGWKGETGVHDDGCEGIGQQTV